MADQEPNIRMHVGSWPASRPCGPAPIWPSLLLVPRLQCKCALCKTLFDENVTWVLIFTCQRAYESCGVGWERFQLLRMG